MTDIYTVHSVVIDQTQAPVTLEGGGKTIALVPCIIVELVSKGIHGSVIRRYVPGNDKERDDLLKKYQVGTEVELTSEVVNEGAGYPEDHRERPLGSAQPLYVMEEPPPSEGPAPQQRPQV